MSYKTNFKDIFNNKLIEHGISLDIPEQKFKKNAKTFNIVLKEIYDKYKVKEVDMYTILLSLNDYFDMKWLFDNVLNSENGSIIKTEMMRDFKITKKK